MFSKKVTAWQVCVVRVRGVHLLPPNMGALVRYDMSGLTPEWDDLVESC